MRRRKTKMERERKERRGQTRGDEERTERDRET